MLLYFSRIEAAVLGCVLKRRYWLLSQSKGLSQGSSQAFSRPTVRQTGNDGVTFPPTLHLHALPLLLHSRNLSSLPSTSQSVALIEP